MRAIALVLPAPAALAHPCAAHIIDYETESATEKLGQDWMIDLFRGRNYSPVSKEAIRVLCGGSVFGRDAKAKPAGRYLRRLPEQSVRMA